MAKSLKISWDEVISLLEKTYNINNIKLMQKSNFQGDNDLSSWNTIDYIEGDLKK